MTKTERINWKKAAKELRQERNQLREECSQLLHEATRFKRECDELRKALADVMRSKKP